MKSCPIVLAPPCLPVTTHAPIRPIYPRAPLPPRPHAFRHTIHPCAHAPMLPCTHHSHLHSKSGCCPLPPTSCCPPAQPHDSTYHIVHVSPIWHGVGMELGQEPAKINMCPVPALRHSPGCARKIGNSFCTQKVCTHGSIVIHSRLCS